MDNRYTTNYNPPTTNRPQTYNSYQTSSSTFRIGNQMPNKQQQRPLSSFYTSGNQSTSLRSYNSSLNSTNQSGPSYGDSASRININRNPITENLNGKYESKSTTKGQQNEDRSSINFNINKGDNLSYNTGQTSSNQANRQKDVLSWTKYLSMEFKVEQLQKIKGENEKQIRQKAKKIAQLDQSLLVTKYHWQRSVKQQERKYQKQLLDQKNNYQSIISTKNKQIQTLLQKIGDQTKAALSEEIQNYLQQILNQNTEIYVQLQVQKQENQNLLKKISDFQLQQNNQELIDKQNQVIKNLTLQLEQLSNRLATRITSTNDFNTFYQVLSSQDCQIKELLSSIQILQQGYSKQREASKESENKLRNINKQQILSTKKQKIQNNNVISGLQYKIIQKQHECFSLLRRLKSTQKKLKDIIQQNRVKTETIKTMVLRITNPELQTQLIGLIQQFLSKTVECSLCQEKLHEIKVLQQKINLLKN